MARWHPAQRISLDHFFPLLRGVNRRSSNSIEIPVRTLFTSLPKRCSIYSMSVQPRRLLRQAALRVLCFRRGALLYLGTIAFGRARSRRVRFSRERIWLIIRKAREPDRRLVK